MTCNDTARDNNWILDVAEIIKPGENITPETQDLVTEIKKLNKPTIIDLVDGIHRTNKNYKIQTISSSKPRVDWQLIGDFSGDRVLDIHGGYGGLPHPLTRQAKETVFLSPCRDQVRFAVEIADLFDYNGLTAINSRIDNIPIKNSSADHIIIGNILEKISILDSISSGNPLRAIISFLEHASKKLKAGGRIYISAENRFNLRQILDVSTNNIGISRFIPTIVHSYGKREKVFWSERQYRRFLEQTGFEFSETYYSLDKGSEYTLFPDGNTLTNHLAQNANQVTNLLPVPSSTSMIQETFNRMGALGELFAPGLLIVGRRSKK